jgi:hypothetical protein
MKETSLLPPPGIRKFLVHPSRKLVAIWPMLFRLPVGKLALLMLLRTACLMINVPHLAMQAADNSAREGKAKPPHVQRLQ